MRARAPFYPEYIANTYNTLHAQQVRRAENLKTVLKERKNDTEKATELHSKTVKRDRPGCVTGVAVGYCSSNHFFYKPVHCGREWCTYCGEDRSPAHIRRVSRVSDAVLSWDALSYMVVTVPEACRESFMSKQMLNDFRNFVRRKLKRDGFEQAVIRWHWAGSCPTCKGGKERRKTCAECSGTGAGKTWEPHLNILTPAGNTTRTTKGGKTKQAVKAYDHGRHTLSADYVKSWRESLSEWFKKHTGKDAVGNIHHNFVGPHDKAKAAKFRHRLRYVMRSTLRHKELADRLYFLKGYRTTTHLGNVQVKKVKQETCCPLCTKPLRWYSETWEKWNEKKPGDLIDVGSGLYFLRFDTT